ncbi:HAL/PAL/TAL family ammonia-lyase [Treponema primitia]|uniref:HAL/PAL/TAL family ammonia-lyase n=1 Tax=Treponema primitia TaxID=88058 RepID=UPI0002554F9F|nr:aromatic amino acid ammonia-lyase [Treponema primitia]
MFILNGNDLDLKTLRAIAVEGEQVAISSDGEARLQDSRKLVYELVEQDVPVYGFNTGVGWNKDRHIASEYFKLYNENLIHSHTLGVREEASEPEVRAAMAIRLNCLLRGNTGIQPEIAHRYAEFLNQKIHPVVPERGSVGEGDISILSHIGLAMIGEGDVYYQGQRMSAVEAHKRAGLKFVELGPKDGLAIVSCNAFGMGEGALTLIDLTDLVDQADLIYAVSLEGLNGNTSPLDPKIHEARRLPGQTLSAALVSRFLKGSYIYEADPDKSVQDPISFRSGAYVHGSLRDALEYVTKFALIQMNSTDDNPCLLLDERRIISCSNFECTTIAVGFEMLGITLSHVSRMSCYRMTKLGTPAFTRLPRFLTPDETHVHAFGALQKTYTLLDTEIRHLSNPSTVDYQAVAGDIEDHANNLPHVAQRIRRITDNLKYILGMEMMHAAQAITLRKQQNPKLRLGAATEAAYEEYRRSVPWYDRDRNLSTDIEASYQLVKSRRMLEAAKSI